MAQFRATIQGQRGQASRLGSKSSGIRTRTNGWHSGVLVEGRAHDSGDQFRIFATGGSSGAGMEYLGAVMVLDGKVAFVAADKRAE